MFSKEGPHPWKTKKGDSRITGEIEAVANAQSKGEARGSIEQVIEKEKHAHAQEMPAQTTSMNEKQTV